MSKSRRVKVVLVHPPLRNLISAATPDYVDKNRGYTPPMGLLYIQAAIEDSRHESVFLDAALEGWDHEETASKAMAYKPDIVGLQAMTFTIVDAHLVAKAIKKIAPNVKIVIGGPHPTLYPEETAGLDCVDYAFSGEGEHDFICFLDVFFDSTKHTKVPGIACSINGKISYTPNNGLLKDLDSIRFPARGSSPYKRYSSVLAVCNPITIMITSRGCPYECIFCNRMGRKYRYHSANYVLDEIDEILKLGIKEIFIHDDTFTLNRSRVINICNGIIERNYDIIWEARTRVDCVNEEMLSLMKKAGCHRLSFGVESGSEKVLRAMRKGTDISRIKEVFAYCRKLGIVTLADFMVGNIDEEYEDIRKSFQLVRELKPDYIQYSICSPYPGTPLYELGLKNKLIPKDVWSEFASNPQKDFQCPVWTQNFRKDELEKIVKKAYRSFYIRPRFIAKQISKLNSFGQFKMMAEGAIGMLRK